MTHPKVAEFAAALERAADFLAGPDTAPKWAADAATLRALREALLRGQEAWHNTKHGGMYAAPIGQPGDCEPVLVIPLPERAESKEKP